MENEIMTIVLGIIFFLIQIGFFLIPFVIMLITAVFLIIGKIFWFGMIIDAISREFSKPDDKVMWVLIIFFTSFIGAAIYYFVGRKSTTKRKQSAYVY